MTYQVQNVVIGAGVVGLAVARALAMQGREVLILEKEKVIGSGISARNSEVIHAGLYYPQGSLKARHCVEGRHMLYEYCATHHVPHRACGKLVVATDEAQRGILETLYQTGTANGVENLTLLNQQELQVKEPAIRGVAALWSPVSGIVDSHALMLALRGDFENHGGIIAFQTQVAAIEIIQGGFLIHTAQDTTLQTGSVINCAGLGAQAVAHAVDGLNAAHIPPLHLAKGNYFTLARKSPFTHLVYPLPEPGGLGVHVTLDMAGQARFGPDVEWIAEEDYAVEAARADRFYEAIRHYWPDLADGDLQPGYAGIRPKITPPGAPAADFIISGPEAHGIPGLVNLFGVESPGLTAALSLAKFTEKAV